MMSSYTTTFATSRSRCGDMFGVRLSYGIWAEGMILGINVVL